MIEIGLVLLALVLLLGLYFALKSIKTLALNALIGLLILWFANAIAGFGIGYSWPVVLVCAFGGALGALVVIVLHLLGVVI